MRLVCSLLATLGVAAFLPAQAIVAATSGLTNPTRVIDFGANVLANFAPVTNQFAGITVTHAAYFTTGFSNNLVGGFLTNDGSGQPNTLSIQFSSQITDLSLVYHQVGANGASNFRAMLLGVTVDSFSGTFSQYQSNNYFGFTNIVFDELQIDFQSDFNVDTLAINDLSAARCVFHNGNNLNPPDFTCASLPVLGTLWQGVVAGNANTILTFLAYAPGGLAGPSPLFGGELLIQTSPAPVAFAAFGSYSLAIPAGSGWLGTVLTFQGFRVDLVGPTSTFVPLNANDLVLGL